MTRLAAVTFRKIGKLHYYPAEGLALEVGTHVIAETQRGLEYGEVKILRDVGGEAADIAQAYRILRIATEDDARTVARRGEQAEEGLILCQNRADHLRLPMKVMEAEVGFDGLQITFYFCAETRIDFRDLVKQMASQMRMRVHLHQVGSRDHAKALGGYGPCGRPLCCTTFLREFAPVSMKMAKDQSLFLNPSKFSGVCGKLMCCLRYEHDLYLEAKERMPPVGVSVACPDGSRGVVTDANYLQETVAVRIYDEDGGWRLGTFRAHEVQIARACGDCGSAGGGCGGSCGPGGCAAAAKAAPMPVIALERWRKNWT
jgi:cell fate regulator YaaT (PSP1 superfamily)